VQWKETLGETLMNSQLIMSGLALGSVYALVALSMVFVWKTTTVLNFAQGEMAMITTFFAYTLMATYEVPYWLAFILTLALGVAIGMLVDFLVRQIPQENFFAVIALTVGIYFVMHSVAGLIWGHMSWPFPSPFSDEPVNVLGAAIAPIDFWVFGVMVLLIAALFLFLNFTTIGTSFRATSQDHIAARLMGISTKRVFSMSWAIGGVVGAIAGVLVAPIIHIHVDMMGHILLMSFASAVLGGINSLPGAVFGGLVLGLVGNFLGAYVSTKYLDSFAFFIIIVILLIRPYGILGRKEASRV
jgi:branched-subunit amino acid ABC-type transport system permease component